MTPLTHQHEPSISGARAVLYVLFFLAVEAAGALAWFAGWTL